MKYLVMGEGLELVNLPREQLVRHIEDLIIPSQEAMAKLERENKVTGGIFSGGRSGVMIVEAASNDEVEKMLMSLPFWGMVKWTVTPLVSFQARATVQREQVEHMKAMA